MLKSLVPWSYFRFCMKNVQYSNISKHVNAASHVMRNELFTVKTFHTTKTFSSTEEGNRSNVGSDETNSPEEPVGSVIKGGKYEVFKDENAPLILDVAEERQRVTSLEEIEEDYNEFDGINLKRGTTGVFDLDDLVDILRKERADDIFVVSIPSKFHYVDYIVVVTGKSIKHMQGMAEFVRRVYKKKRDKSDLIPRLEGEKSKDWMALDLGNIALHIMSRTARPVYDIESLWSLGKEYDENSNDFDDERELEELLKKHEINLDDFLPADANR